MPGKPLSTQPLKNKRILVINTGSLKKRFILQRLKKLGLHTIVVNKEVNWAKPYVDEWILANTASHDETLRQVKKYLKHNSVDGVVTFWEDDVLLTAKIAEKFGLIGIPYEVAKKVRDKYAFREFCQENKLPAPRHCLIQSENDFKTLSQQVTFPVVIKPTHGSSSSYVIKAEDMTELKEVYSYLKENVSTTVESALQDSLSLMVEEYIDGDEVDIDILVQNGKIKFYSITDNWQTQEPFFVDNGEAIPSTLHPDSQQELISMAEITLEKLGIMNGCIHFEAKYSNQGPVPIEVNLRMGGDCINLFVKDAWHVDLIEGAVDIAIGNYIEKIDKPSKPYRYLATQELLADKSGVISSLDVPESFSKKYHVEEFNFFKEVGDSVFVPPEDYEFLGWITASGDNHNDARDNLEAAVKKIDYEIVPFSGESAIGKTKRTSQFKAASFKSDLFKSRAKIEKIRHTSLQNQRKLVIGIACNTFDRQQGGVEAELSAVGDNIQQTLNERGYKTVFIDFNKLNKAVSLLQSGTIDLVFNVGERLNGSSLLEPHIASLFDAFQIPYTGSNPFTLGLCIDKIKVKKLLTYHNIPTAKWDYVYDVNEEIRTDLKFPLIVKPANTDNSIGITNDSVVTDKKQLKRQVEYVVQQLQRPALIEEYLDGDEYDVSIMGSEEEDLTVLPLSRTIFAHLPEGQWHIYPFDVKFGENSKFKKQIIEQRPPKNVSQKLLSLISEIALDTYNILDCHDYGRVEIKLDANNNPHVLELNPNPSINTPDCLPSVAKLVGMDYGDFLEKIISLAIKRYQNKTPYFHLQSTMF